MSAATAADSGGLGVGPSNGASVVVPSKLGNGGIVLTPSQLKNDGSVSVDEIQLPASTQDAMVNTTMGLSMVGSSDTMCRSGVSAPMPGGAVAPAIGAISAANVPAARRMGPKSRRTRTSRGQLQDPNEGSARDLQAAKASDKVSSSGDLTTSASRPKAPSGTPIVPRSQFALDARAEKGDKEYQNVMLMPDSKDYITSSVFA